MITSYKTFAIGTSKAKRWLSRFIATGWHVSKAIFVHHNRAEDTIVFTIQSLDETLYVAFTGVLTVDCNVGDLWAGKVHLNTHLSHLSDTPMLVAMLLQRGTNRVDYDSRYIGSNAYPLRIVTCKMGLGMYYRIQVAVGVFTNTTSLDPAGEVKRIQTSR